MTPTEKAARSPSDQAADRAYKSMDRAFSDKLQFKAIFYAGWRAATERAAKVEKDRAESAERVVKAAGNIDFDMGLTSYTALRDALAAHCLAAIRRDET